MHPESGLAESTVPPHLPVPLPIYSIATTALCTTSSVPASVIVSSSGGAALQPPASRELSQSHNTPPADSKVPQFSAGPSQQALGCQVAPCPFAKPTQPSCFFGLSLLTRSLLPV